MFYRIESPLQITAPSPVDDSMSGNSIMAGKQRYPSISYIFAVASVLLILLVACSDGAGNSPEVQPQAPPAPAADTPTPSPDGEIPPVVNVQFVGGDDLSDESKSSLADLIERVQDGVVQIEVGGVSASDFVISSDGLVVTNEQVVRSAHTVTV